MCSVCDAFFFLFFCGTGVLTLGFYLEPLHQASFCDGFFKDRVL
jgi:hypothetical protein